LQNPLVNYQGLVVVELSGADYSHKAHLKGFNHKESEHLLQVTPPVTEKIINQNRECQHSRRYNLCFTDFSCFA
jgi:hypothetical protein